MPSNAVAGCPTTCSVRNCLLCPCVCPAEAARQALLCLATCCPCCGSCCGACAKCLCPNPTRLYGDGSGSGDGTPPPAAPATLAMERGVETRFFVL